MHPPRVILRAVLGAGVLACLAAPATAQLQSPKSLSLRDTSDLPSTSSRLDVGSSVNVDFSGASVRLDPKKRPKVILKKKLDPVQGDASVSRWQFGDVVLEDPSDPDSDVESAVLYMAVGSMTAGTTDLDHEIDNGTAGDSGEADIATEYQDRIEIDLGGAKFVVAKDGSILKEGWTGTHQVFTSGAVNGLYVVDGSGTTFSSAWGPCTVTLQENGPAFARVSIQGLMEDPQGNILTDYELQLLAWYGSDSLRATFEVTPGYWTNSDDLQISQIHLLTQVASNPLPALDASTARRAVLGGGSTGEGLVAGVVTSQGPDPYQVVSLNGLGDPRGATGLSRSPTQQWGMSLDPGGFLFLNVGFTKHFVAANANYRELAEFALGIQDPVPGDLDYHGRNLIYDIEATVLD